MKKLIKIKNFIIYNQIGLIIEHFIKKHKDIKEIIEMIDKNL